jgi:molecular chaperone DnaK
MGKIIGIDLGTTNSSSPSWRQGAQGHRQRGGRPHHAVRRGVGRQGRGPRRQVAKRQAITNPEGTVYSAKRFIGRSFDGGRRGGQARALHVIARATATRLQGPGKVARAARGLGARAAQAQAAAENYLGETVTDAVITVPAYFNDSQRQATKDAGKIAGPQRPRIINEPTAAALAYGLDKKKDEVIAVYDFGGGTFDISVLEVGDNVVEVVSTNGDTHLGGDDVDNRVMDYLIAEFKKDTGIDVGKDKMVIQRLKDAAEKAKIELSSSSSRRTVNLPFLTADASGPKHLNIKVTRAKLEQMIERPRRAQLRGP